MSGNQAIIYLFNVINNSTEELTTREEKIKSEKINLFADQFLLSYMSESMGAKLEEARLKIYGGWWSEDVCSISYLKEQLMKKLSEDDMISVANFAAMIHIRNELDKLKKQD